jgi:electron transfer flavoprotein alpha subunit
MSVLVYAESEGGKLKKVAFEVASYGKAVADQMGTEVIAVTFNVADADALGNYGVSKVMNITVDGNFDAKIYASKPLLMLPPKLLSLVQAPTVVI